MVRRPDSGLHRLPAVPVRMVSQSGGSAGQRSSRRHKWPGRCRDGCTPRRTVVLTWRLRGAAVVQAGVSRWIARTCRAVPGRSSGQGRRATRPWAGRREVAEACRSAEHGARIAGPGPGGMHGRSECAWRPRRRMRPVLPSSAGLGAPLSGRWLPPSPPTTGTSAEPPSSPLPVLTLRGYERESLGVCSGRGISLSLD